MNSVRRLYELSHTSKTQFAKDMGVSRSTLYRVLKSSHVSAERYHQAQHANGEANHSRVAKASHDSSTIVELPGKSLHQRYAGQQHVFTGRQARTLHREMTKANIRREKHGLNPMSIKDTYVGGKNSDDVYHKLISIFKNSNSAQKLSHVKASTQIGFKASVIRGLERGGMGNKIINAAWGVINKMSMDEVDKMYQASIDQEWNIKGSPTDEYGNPREPDTGAILAYLGLSTTVTHSVLNH